jgi:hypothetical protein
MRNASSNARINMIRKHTLKGYLKNDNIQDDRNVIRNTASLNDKLTPRMCHISIEIYSIVQDGHD